MHLEAEHIDKWIKSRYKNITEYEIKDKPFFFSWDFNVLQKKYICNIRNTLLYVLSYKYHGF